MNLKNIKAQAKALMKGSEKTLAIPALFCFGAFLLAAFVLYEAVPPKNPLGFCIFSFVLSFCCFYIACVFACCIKEFRETRYFTFEGFFKPAVRKAAHISLCCALFSSFGLIGLYMFFVPFAFVAIAFAFMPNAVSEAKPGDHFRDIVKASFAPLKGNIKAYMMFLAMFSGWLLLVVLTFGFAAVYVMPYFSISKAIFYESLMDLYLKDFMKVYSKESG